MTEKGGGLVKNLLFPSFTDAGANDTFRPTTRTAASHDSMEDMTTSSEATTAVHDNRATSKPQQHEEQYDGDRVGGYAPSGSTQIPSLISQPTTTRPVDDSMNTETGATSYSQSDEVNSEMENGPDESPPGLPPSKTTRPFPLTNPSSSSNKNTAEVPPSPRPMVRPAPPERSVSTTAFVGGMTSVTPRIMPFPTTSPSLKAVEPENHTQDAESNVAQSSFALTATSSGVSSSALGYQFSQQGRDEESLDTPVKSNVSRKDSDDVPEIRPLTMETLKEMEQPRDGSNDAISDVNSNISEYGTVIEAPGRLADVQAMAAMVEAEEGNSKKAPLLTPMKEEPDFASLQYSDRSHECASDELESVALTSEVAGLALPSLEGPGPRNPLAEMPSPLKLSPSHRPPPNENQSQMAHSAPEIPSENIPQNDHDQPETSASSMVTAAFRRIAGSGVGSLTQMRTPIPTPTNGVTAPPPTPPTPRPDYARPRPGSSVPPSFLLRSPGSLAHFSSQQFARNDYNAHLLSPRYRAFSSPQKPQVTRLRHANSLSSPLRFARGGLSYDPSAEEGKNYVRTIRESSSSMSASSAEAERPDASKYRSKSWDAASSVLAVPGHNGPFIRRDFRVLRPNGSTFHATANSSAFRAPDAVHMFQSDMYSEAIAEADESTTPSRLLMRKAYSPAVLSSRDAVSLRTPNRIEIEREDALDILACLVQRSRDFVQKDDKTSVEDMEKKGKGEEVIEETASGQSVSSEKESNHSGKASPLDVGDSSTASDTEERSNVATSIQKSNQIDESEVGSSVLSDSGDSDLFEAIDLLRQISRTHTKGGESTAASRIDHEARMKAVDELLRSHTYASEMKQAATSASAWLRSIGREDMQVKEGDNVSKTAGAEVVPEEEGKEASPASTENMDLVAMKAMLHAAELKSREQEEAAQRLNEELSKCRAEIGRLKMTSRTEHVYTSPDRSILDADDSTASSEDASKVEDSGAIEEIGDGESPIPKTSGEGSSGDALTSFDESFLRSEIAAERSALDETRDWAALVNAKREIILLKAALAQANNAIGKQEPDTEVADDARESTNRHTVTLDHPDFERELDEYKEAVQKAYEAETRAQALESSFDSPNERTVNVRMLDGENFTTEWDELAPPLPPPPDHGLRSPIVKDLLDQWTSDASMQSSLLSWMDRVMSGEHPRNIPPLTISSLNHQVRDGFSMHLLPLLLRRSDIRVDVTTRAHRMTTYDMAVTVSTSMPGAGSTDDQSQASSNSNAFAGQRADKKHMMAFKASHGSNHVVEEPAEDNSRSEGSEYFRLGNFSRSFETRSDSVTHSAVTAHITNSSRAHQVPSQPPTAQAENDADQYLTHPASSLMGDEASVGSSISRSSGSQRSNKEQQSGLMSTIGGALGLLGRRKPAQNHPPDFRAPSFDDETRNFPDPVPQEDLPPFLKPPASPLGANASLPPFPRSESESEPYHRVVSAPPGRIGVTFVEYRGHAVVSDVARDSPLSGWVFASDILIAIDEIPVSGMRVRDIVSILTGRKDRQRALRVISSHAMNEALNTSTLSEVNAG